MVVRVVMYPQIPLVLLGLAVGGIFISAKYFGISNKSMALASAFAFLCSALYLAFEKHALSVFGRWLSMDQWQQLDAMAGDFSREDPGALLISLIVFGLAFAGSLFNAAYLAHESRQRAFYPLVLLMVCGLVGLLYSPGLVNVYLFSEMTSISAYALVAFRRDELQAVEAGYKYLVMGSVASVIMLLGIALIFLSAGTLDISDISSSPTGMVMIGGLLIFSGFSLKSAVVPLHAWLPDAHGKAPSSVSALLSGILVEVALYVMLRIGLTLGIQPILLGSILLLLSGLNVIVGNLMGTAQTNIKRMLGYSTIAQMGYIILAIAVGLRNGSLPAIQSGLFILVSHACAKGLAFLSAGVFNQSAGIHELKDLRSHSGLALFPVFSMALAALSLAAVPPFPGFTGKWMVLTSLFQTEDPFRFVMAMVLLSGSLIAFGYYLPLLVNLFSRLIQEKEPEGTRANTKLSLWFSLPLAFLGIVILWFTLFPQVLLDGVAPVAEYLLEGMI